MSGVTLLGVPPVPPVKLSEGCRLRISCVTSLLLFGSFTWIIFRSRTRDVVASGLLGLPSELASVSAT